MREPDNLFGATAMIDPGAHPADADDNPPVVGTVWDATGPRRIGRHQHKRGQLIYVARGSASIATDDAVFVVPPQRALWLPPATPHEVVYPREVAFRGIFVAPDLCSELPRRTTVVQVDALTRELIDAGARLPWRYPEDGPEARLLRVLLDRLTVLPTTALRLPEGQDGRVRRVMEGLRAAPGDDRPLAAWAREVHASERTLARRFRADTGLSFAMWRQQLRLLTALERLAAGDPVTMVAIDLGYHSTSSFTTMFKRALGVPPSAYFGG